MGGYFGTSYSVFLRHNQNHGHNCPLRIQTLWSIPYLMNQSIIWGFYFVRFLTNSENLDEPNDDLLMVYPASVSAVHPPRPGRPERSGHQRPAGEDWWLWPGAGHQQRFQLRCERKRMSDNHFEMYFIIAELRSVYGIGQNVVVFKRAQLLTYITKNWNKHAKWLLQVMCFPELIFLNTKGTETVPLPWPKNHDTYQTHGPTVLMHPSSICVHILVLAWVL